MRGAAMGLRSIVGSWRKSQATPRMWRRSIMLWSRDVELSPLGQLQVVLRDTPVRLVQQELGAWDRVSVEAHAEVHMSSGDQAPWTDQDAPHVERDDVANSVRIHQKSPVPGIGRQVQLLVKTPPRVELHLDCHSDIAIEGKFEGEQHRIRCETGSLHIDRLRAMKVWLQTRQCRLNAKEVQGDLSFEGVDTAVSIGLMQSKAASVAVESTSPAGGGSFVVEAAYVEQGQFEATGLPIKLGTFHGRAMLRATGMSGAVAVDSAEGSLEVVADSDVTLMLSRPENVTVEARGGAVTIGVPTDRPSSLDCIAPSLSVDNSLDQLQVRRDLRPESAGQVASARAADAPPSSGTAVITVYSESSPVKVIATPSAFSAFNFTATGPVAPDSRLDRAARAELAPSLWKPDDT